MHQSLRRARPGASPSSLATVGFVVGASATAMAGFLIQAGVVPSTDVSEDLWRYPWESTTAFVATAIIYAALHVLIIAGLVAFERQGIAGSSSAARRGVRVATAGTALLLLGEVASIPLADALVDDTAATIVGGVFGLALATSAVGFLLCGWATVRAGVWTDWRRFTPLATGIWTTVMIPLTAVEPTVLPGSVAIYGLGLLAIATGMALELPPASTSAPGVELQHA